MKTIELDTRTIKIPLDGTSIGIENIKEVVKYIGKVAKNVRDFKEDGKYSFWEKMKTGFIAAGGVIQLAADAGKIWREIKDLDQSEISDLVLYVADEFKIDKEKAGQFVTQIVIPCLKILEEGSTIFDGVGDIFGKKKDK